MIRIAVVDDDPQARRVLVDHLTRFEVEHGTAFTVQPFAEGATLTGAAYVPRFDIVFLDVQMEKLDGFATARLIRETDPSVILIFVTNMAEYAIRGYEVDALSYLLKPVPYFAFAQEMLRSLRRLETTLDPYVIIGTGAERVRIDTRDVLYVESVKHRVVFRLRGGDRSIVGTLRDTAEQLESRGFYRSNSFLLVNLRHVTVISNQTATMSGGAELPISRSRKKGLLDALAQHFGGEVT